MGAALPGEGGCLAPLHNSVVDMGCTLLGGMAWYLAPLVKKKAADSNFSILSWRQFSLTAFEARGNQLGSLILTGF